MPNKPRSNKAAAPKARQPEEKATGKYVYDKALKRVVKVSDDIPGLNKAGGGESGACCPHGGCCGHGNCSHG